MAAVSQRGKGLNIVVCIKQVPHAENLIIDPETRTLKREGVPAVVNPPDENAVELALHLKDKLGGRVTVMTMGPPSASSALRELLAKGADEAILLCDRAFAGADTYPTSLVLAWAISMLDEKRCVDLIVCGEETTDSSTAHVGPGIAEHLDLPQATFVESLEIDADKRVARAKRALEGAFEVVEFTLPGVVTASLNMNIPREATLQGKVRSKGAKIITWTADDLKIPKEWIGFKGSPTWVSKIDTQESELRDCENIPGENPKQAAIKLVEALVKKGVLQ
jgi:electron transfer flavoprotein beta subunit